jgi:hypothetical protein
VTLGLSRELGAARGVTLGLVNAGWAVYDYETSKTDYFFGTLGVKHRLTEIFNLTADVGTRYTDSDFKVQKLAIVPPGVLAVVTEDENSSGWGGIGHLAVEYAGERTRANLGVSHDIKRRADSGVVSARARLAAATYCRSSGGDFSAVSNKSEDEFSAPKSAVHLQCHPSLRWEFYRDDVRNRLRTLHHDRTDGATPCAMATSSLRMGCRCLVKTLRALTAPQ